jgi:hypothetical protein
MIAHVPKIGFDRGTNARNVEIGQLAAYGRHSGQYVLKMNGLAPQAKQPRNLGTIEERILQVLFH